MDHRFTRVLKRGITHQIMYSVLVQCIRYKIFPEDFIVNNEILL